MNPETIQAVKDALTPLAQKLGQGAEQLFALAIRENYVTAIKEIFWTILFVVIGVVWYTLSKVLYAKANKWEEENPKSYMMDDENGWAIGFICAAVVGCVLGVVLLFVGIFNVDDAIGRLINPQWYAIKDILGMLPVAK